LFFQQVRNLDYMCLRLIKGDAPEDVKNYIEFHDDGRIIIKLREYKTNKTYGQTKLDLSCFPELTQAIERYLKCRHRLLSGHKHNFFFMRRSGEPFLASAQFAHYLQQNYKSFADGITFTTTSLRKALTNYTYASNKPPEVLKAISRLMAHSEETHTKYYHTKRSQHLVEIGAAALAEDTSQKLGFKCRNKTASADDIPCVDQIVALVSGTSNIQKPEIWLAKVMEVDCETKRAVLAELVEDEANCYKFKIGSKYTEPFSSLIFPVDVCYDESHNLYHLRSNKLDIHNFVEEQHQDSSGDSDNYG
jgi:isochorismate synthase EntC